MSSTNDRADQPAQADQPAPADQAAPADRSPAPPAPSVGAEPGHRLPTQRDEPNPEVRTATIPMFGPASLKMQLPNILTGARLVMTIAFIALGSLYAYDRAPIWMVYVSLGLFVLAAATDWLDGYLARKWGAVSIFGRVMDPLADKLLVLSAFILLAGPGFAGEVVAAGDGGAVGEGAGSVRRQMSGTLPWMAALILARELLVTSLRGVCESRGIDFSASMTGKLKMVAQSGAVPLILLLVAIADAAPAGSETPETLATVNLVVALLVTAITAASAWPYLTRAYSGLRDA